MRTYVYKNRLLRMFIATIDAGGYSFKKVFSFFKKEDIKEIKQVLIFKADHAGDVLLATPAIKAIRKQFPLAHITLIVGPWAKGIIEGEKYIDEIICYRTYRQDRDLNRSFNIRGSLNLIQTLRRGKYDIFFDLRGDLFAIIIAALSGIPRRIGYGWEGGGFLLTDEVKTTTEKHQVEILLDAIRTIGIKPETPRIDITILEEDRRYVNALLGKKGWDESSISMGFHVGSGCQSKMWPVERFADLMKRVYGELKAQVILVGGTDDIEITKRLENLLSFKPINAVGMMAFKQTAALIERCAVFIGNDSAPVHIAAAVGTPTIVIFSAANDWHRWRPYGNDVDVIYKDVKCKGCEKAVCDTMECMKLITVDEVFNLILKKNQGNMGSGVVDGIR